MGYDDNNLNRVKDRVVIGLFALAAAALVLLVMWLIKGKI